MKRAFATAAITALAACGPPDAAVRLGVTVGGVREPCVRIGAEDAKSGVSAVPVDVRAQVAPGETGSLTVALYPRAGWGADVEVWATLHEESCDGPAVAGAARSVQFAPGVQRLELHLLARDDDADGFPLKSDGAGSDCDDARATAFPGAPELCNQLDDDCDGVADNDIDLSLIRPDHDGDGFGDPQPASGAACDLAVAAAWVANGDDCDDANGAISPAATELCDAVDNNCDGTVDETFEVGATCDAPGCGGTWACNAAGGRSCIERQPSDWFSDLDGDGAAGSFVVNACISPDPSYQPANNDCDEGDPFTGVGFAELCDGRDNDCAGDGEAAICATAAWRTVSVPGEIDFRSVSSWKPGHVWMAGSEVWEYDDQNGLKTYANSSPCEGSWVASWAARSGRVYLASSEGRVVSRDPGGACAMVAQLSGAITGLRGVEDTSGVTLFASTGSGAVSRITSAGAVAPLGSASNVRFNAVDAAGSLVIAVGSQSQGMNKSRIYHHDGNTFVAVVHPEISGGLEGVDVVDATLAYAVGADGTVLRWNGSVWEALAQPQRDCTLTGVKAFGAHLAYVVSSNCPGVWRWDGMGWTKLSGATSALNAIDGVSPGDMWVAGEDQLIMRWSR